MCGRSGGGGGWSVTPKRSTPVTSPSQKKGMLFVFNKAKETSVRRNQMTTSFITVWKQHEQKQSILLGYHRIYSLSTVTVLLLTHSPAWLCYKETSTVYLPVLCITLLFPFLQLPYFNLKLWRVGGGEADFESLLSTGTMLSLHR